MDYDRVTAMFDKTFAFALNRTFSREEAEELTQEILFQAIKSLDSLLDDNKFEPWFWRIADITHKVFKRGRAKERATMSYDEVNVPATNDDYTFIREDEYQNLRRQIAFLSASYRDIIVMHYYDNLSCKAISQILGLPEGTVTYRLSLARTKLKERCSQMTETALKPAQLKIRIHGEGSYDGGLWEYTGFYNDGSCGSDVGISMEKSMNSFKNGKLAHYSYHFAPFAYRKMLFSHEIDVCQAVLQKQELSENQKEIAAKLIADGYLAKDEYGNVVCAIPMFTKEQYDFFLACVKTIFADFLPFYTEEVKKYLSGYMKLFPKHLKDATERNGFHD